MTPNEVAATLQHFNDWRRGHHDEQPDPRVIGEAIDAAVEMIDRLEAAESARRDDYQNWMTALDRNADLLAKLEAAENNNSDWLYANAPGGWVDNLRIENEALQAKIAEMERQAPVAEIGQQYTLLFAGSGSITGVVKRHGLKIGDKLYAIPGAQPAPSVPEGWMRAIDEALFTAHIGVANAHDTYEQAKAKIDNLIGFNVDIATDPAVNGGWKLVPIEPTRKMLDAGEDTFVSSLSGTPTSSPIAVYRAMINASPEAKP